jgi:hypothetical protein
MVDQDDPREWRDLGKRNESRSAGLPGEEPRNVRKAGGGVRGPSQGGAVVGRRGSHVTKVSNRQPKPRHS